MSKYSEKILRGQRPDENDWQEHLLESHRNAPQMTPRVFASYKDNQGLSSYDRLVSYLTGKEHKIVDLACGNGFLVPKIRQKNPTADIYAIDMSAAELGEAKKRFSGPKIEFLLENSKNLSLHDESIDTVLCHLGLMLMSPIEPVLKNIRRILKPSGRLIFVTKGTKVPHSLAQKLFVIITSSVLEKTGLEELPHTGDPRFGDIHELSDLLSQFNFELKSLEEHALQVKEPPEKALEQFRHLYLVEAMDRETRTKISEKLFTLLKDHVDANGMVSYELPFRFVEVCKKK